MLNVKNDIKQIELDLFATGQVKDCKITEEEAQACGSRMMLINENFTMPKDEQDIAKRCDDIESAINCFKDYAKNCIDSFSSRIVAMAGKNGKKLKDRICGTKESRTEFLTHIGCWGTAENMAPINLCTDKYIVQMESLADMANLDRIPATCCSFHMFQQCVKTKGAETCDKPESVEYMEGISTGMTGDMLKMICGKYKTLDECDTNWQGDKWNELKAKVASDDPKEIKAMRKYASPFGAFKDIMSKMKKT